MALNDDHLLGGAQLAGGHTVALTSGGSGAVRAAGLLPAGLTGTRHEPVLPRNGDGWRA